MIEEYEERAAIMEHDAGLTKKQAEDAALTDAMNTPPCTYKEGTVLFVAEDKIENIEIARDYIKKFGLTSDDVKIVRSKEGVFVKTKRNVEWPPKEQ